MKVSLLGRETFLEFYDVKNNQLFVHNEDLYQKVDSYRANRIAKKGILCAFLGLVEFTQNSLIDKILDIDELEY